MASAQSHVGSSSAPGDPRIHPRAANGAQPSAGNGSSSGSSNGAPRMLSVKEYQMSITDLHKKTVETHQTLTSQMLTSHDLARSITEWAKLPDGELKESRAPDHSKLLEDRRTADADVKKTSDILVEQLTKLERHRFQLNKSSPSTSGATSSAGASGSSVTVTQLNDMKTQLQADFEARLAQQEIKHEAAIREVKRQSAEDLKAAEATFRDQLVEHEKEMVMCLKEFGTTIRESLGQRVDSYVIDQIDTARQRLKDEAESLVKKHLLQHGKAVPPAPAQRLFSENGKLKAESLDDVMEQIKARFETSTLARDIVQHGIHSNLAEALASPPSIEILRRAGVRGFGFGSPEPPSTGGAKRRRIDDGPAPDSLSEAKIDKLVERLERGQVYNAEGVKDDIKEWVESQLAPVLKDLKETKRHRDATDTSRLELQTQLDELHFAITAADLQVTKSRVDRMHRDHGQTSQRMQTLWDQHENPPQLGPVNAVTPVQLNNAIQGLRQDVSTSYLTKAAGAELYPALDDFNNLNDIVGTELDNGEAYRSRVLRALGLSMNVAGEGDEAARETFFGRLSLWLDTHVPLRPSLAKHVMRLLLRSFELRHDETEGRGDDGMDVDRAGTQGVDGAASGAGGHGQLEDEELVQLLRDLSTALHGKIDASPVVQQIQSDYAKVDSALTNLLASLGEGAGQEGEEEEERDELEGDGADGDASGGT